MKLDNTLWNQWNADWKWILSIAEKREWDFSDLKIERTVSEEQICDLEKEIENKLPEDFRYVLKNYSSRIDFNWHMGDEEIENFKALFCGGSDGLLWGFDQLASMYESYLRWIEVCYPNPDDPYDKIWHNKIPFLEVGNGDFIAFDIQKGKDIYPVMYLSHDGDDFHGSCLANSFVEFITNWSNIGCIGTECWTLEIFYDKDKNKLMSDSPLIDEWKEALLKD